MFTPPEHVFEINGHHFRFVKYSQAGLRRINQQYAMKLSLTGVIPSVLEFVFGTSLYREALLAEGLKEAPPHWYEELPAKAGTNGTPIKVLSFEVDPDEFEAVAKEVDTFLASFRRPASTDSLPDGGETTPGAVAAPETVPPSTQLRAY